MAFTVPDIFIAVLVVIFVIRGYARGWLREIFSLAAIGVGIVAAAQYDDLGGVYARIFLGDAAWIQAAVAPGVFLAAWVASLFVVRILFGLLSKGDPPPHARLVGAVVGCFKGALFAAILLIGIETYAPAYPLGGDGEKFLPYVRELSTRIRSLDLMEMGRSLGAIGETLGTLREGSGADGQSAAPAPESAEQPPPEPGR